MAEPGKCREDVDDVEAVTRAVLTASRLLVAVSARSLAQVEERVTLPQFRMLVVLSTRGATKLVTLAEHLQVADADGRTPQPLGWAEATAGRGA